VNVVHQTTRLRGICSSRDHHTDSCPQLQETSSSSMESVVGIFQGQPGMYKPQ